MKLKMKGKQTFIITLALCFILCFNFTLSAFSTYIKNTSDGVYYDDFEDYNNDINNAVSSGHLESYDKCILENGSIILAEGTNIFNYDFATTPNEHEAWDANLSSIFGGDYELLRLKNPIGEKPISGDGHKVKNDGKVVETQSSYIDWEILNVSYTFTPFHHYRFKINQKADNVDYFKISWYFGDKLSNANIDSLLLYVWDYSSLLGMWINELEIDYSDVGTNPSGDLVLTSTDVGYISDDNYIDFLIVAVPESNGETSILTTDYLQLTIKTKKGYMDGGHIISESINTGGHGSWESLIWSSSGAGNDVYVEMQVLDSSNNVIASGTTSPVNLVNLDSSYTNVKLKAILHTNDLSSTPRLHSWGLLWQKQSNQFQDLFSSTLRIDRTIGIEISGGIMSMSDTYNDWPIFGKNPDNTRSFEGDGPTSSNLYWKTDKETVGGGLRAPVLSENKIYIASSVDNKIYAFDAIGTTSLKNPVDSSESSYVVDSSPAVGGDLLIIGTCDINGTNKVIALDKNDLKVEKWKYPSSDDVICFSSSPTISDDKVFVTSWNGAAWDTPLLSFLYMILGGNNKIISLNLADGTIDWEQELPAGSFSTPAVGDDMVVAGCENIFGKSLFAFDIQTGEKLWNTSVGMIGLSSPVIYGDKVFVVAKKQSFLSFKGDIEIVAVYKQNGTIAWNQTIAENILFLESLPKGLKLYHMMATSTPSVQENVVYVSGPKGKIYAFDSENGAEKWSIELPSSIFGVIPTFSCTSPIVTTNTVYIAMPNGVVYALDKTNGDEKWSFDCVTQDPEIGAISYILASPIVADGVLYASVTEEFAQLSGRIYAIGDYKPSSTSKAYSKAISVPNGKWWNKFEASKSGPITFSILDENYNVLIANVENGDVVSNSNINSNQIRLLATLSNKTANPTLNSWKITWTTENANPLFNENSFTPDINGWINTNKPNCTIAISDQGVSGVLSGLNIDSAKYQIEYIQEGSSTSKTEWFTATSDDSNGVVETILMANLFDLNIAISEVKNIRFYIEDLAGNSATSQLKNFKMDITSPTSEIDNPSSYASTYKTSVDISASADDEDSGIRNVGLYYKGGDYTDWTLFDSAETIFEWLFKPEGETSGGYEICTIATDNAGNTETLPSTGQISFIYDSTLPYIDTDFADEYRYNELPEFSITFKDDYQLKTVEYRPSFETSWTVIDTNIGDDTYDEDWNILQKHWNNMTEGVEYIIHFRLTDLCGNQYSTIFGDEGLKLIKDMSTSKSYLDLSDFSQWHWDDLFTLTTNIPSGVNITQMELYYRYSSDNSEWSDWEQYDDKLTNSPFEWDFKAREGSGYYQFYTKTWNSAGMVGTSPNESVTVTLFPVGSIILMIIFFIILIIISSMILGKIRQ